MAGARGLQSDDKRFKEERTVVVAGCAKHAFMGELYGVWIVSQKKEGRRGEETIAGNVSYRGSCTQGVACVPNYSFLQYALYIPQWMTGKL